jgi:hypothetical protein
MARFFFNHCSAGNVSVDEIGTEYSSIEAAYLDTYEAMLEIAFEKLRTRHDPAQDAFEIMDDQGHLLMHVPFSEVLRPRRATKAPTASRQIIATCDRQMKRTQTLKAELREEFNKTESSLQLVRANLARLRPVTEEEPPEE